MDSGGGAIITPPIYLMTDLLCRRKSGSALVAGLTRGEEAVHKINGDCI